jgi:hypothetical protein
MDPDRARPLQLQELTLRTRRLNMDYSKPWMFEETGKGREEAFFRPKEAN